METIKRKINALKDEIERKDEGRELTLEFLFPEISDIHHLRDQLNRQKNEREHYEQEATSLVRKVSSFFPRQSISSSILVPITRVRSRQN